MLAQSALILRDSNERHVNIQMKFTDETVMSLSSDSKDTPIFKRARYRPERRHDLPFDGDEYVIWDESGEWIEWVEDDDDDYDADYETEEDENQADPRFWTSNRVLMALIALIIIITLLAYSFEGIVAPPPPPPTQPPPPGALI
jgi:hypothetical protein